jgi:hypothetical protein
MRSAKNITAQCLITCIHSPIVMGIQSVDCSVVNRITQNTALAFHRLPGACRGRLQMPGEPMVLEQIRGIQYETF